MSATDGALSVEETRILTEAAEWRLIGLLFECPRDGWRAEVAQLAQEVTDPLLVQAASAAREQASEGLYHSIFGPGGPVPPREVTYLGAVQFGYLLSELNAYYEAFAYRSIIGEAEDHLAVEVGFVAYLLVKQAYALACGDREHAAVAREAAERFRAEHLSLMVQPIARALANGGPPFLVMGSEALLARVGPPARSVLPLADGLAAGTDDDEMVCGSEIGPVPLAGRE